MTLPADSHVHTEWSWDTEDGSMERTCARAVELGLPAVAFTEHADHTRLTIPPGSLFEADHPENIDADRTLLPPPLDIDGYLECVQRCRHRFPELRIITGVELGEAHRHPEIVAGLLAGGRIERVLGSLHALPDGPEYFEPPDLYGRHAPDDVIRAYLAELHHLIKESDVFSVLAHIDYPIRYWPPAAGPFELSRFEEEFRHVLRLLADSGRALEVNTRLPLDQTIMRWWREAGGEAVTFGSDAHEPGLLANGFTEAQAMVEAVGFRRGRHPYDLWVRE